MAEISAKMVAALREATGLGMMECKKALVETEGDIQKAEELLRIKSGAKASKVAGRTAAEGTVAQFISADGKVGALAEINCETDFVAKDDGFLSFVKTAVQLIAEANPADVEALGAVKTAEGVTLEEVRKALIAKVGENIGVRRFVRYETAGKLATYLHGAKIGVLVDLTGGNETIGKDVAMHIAASKPVCVSKEEVSQDLLAKEREIYTAQAAESGKPANIVEKMVEGRIQKYLAEITLLGQQFVKNPDVTVEKMLADAGAKVARFQMFVVGEGIEKKVVDFAAEVAAAAKV